MFMSEWCKWWLTGFCYRGTMVTRYADLVQCFWGRFDELRPLLERIFAEYGGPDGVELRQRRYLWKAVVAPGGPHHG